MKMNVTALAVGASLTLLASQTNAASQQVVDVDDLKNKSNNAKKCADLGCLLNMGTFSSEKYANQYKENLAKKTNQPVTVKQDSKNKNLFHVIVGPFNDFAQMLKTGTNLSSKTSKQANKSVAKQLSQSKKANVEISDTSDKYSDKISSFTSSITKPVGNIINLFKFKHDNTNDKAPNSKSSSSITTKKRNVQTTTFKPYVNKQQQIFKAQTDYPINQDPKVDAKGNIIPIFKAGPYLGASVGVQSNLARIPASVGYQAFGGTLSAGIGHMFTHRIYLGGEFYLNDNIRAKAYSVSLDGFTLQNGFNFGGDLIPGFMITDSVLGYFRVGVMRALFEGTPPVSLTTFNGPTIPGTSIPAIKRINKTVNGWQVGVGSQTNLYKNLDGRAEYIYSQFEGITVRNSKGNINQVNIGLVYKFNDLLHKTWY